MIGLLPGCSAKLWSALRRYRLRVLWYGPYFSCCAVDFLKWWKSCQTCWKHVGRPSVARKARFLLHPFPHASRRSHCHVRPVVHMPRDAQYKNCILLESRIMMKLAEKPLSPSVGSLFPSVSRRSVLGGCCCVWVHGEWCGELAPPH